MMLSVGGSWKKEKENLFIYDMRFELIFNLFDDKIVYLMLWDENANSQRVKDKSIIENLLQHAHFHAWCDIIGLFMLQMTIYQTELPHSLFK